MVDFLFIWIGLVVGLADTLGDNLWIAFLVTSVFAICALHACGVFEEFPTECATHDVVELLGNKFVALLFVNIFLLLTHSTLTVQTNIEGAAVLELFG